MTQQVLLKHKNTFNNFIISDHTLSWSWGIVILAVVLDIFGIVMVVLAVRKVT